MAPRKLLLTPVVDGFSVSKTGGEVVFTRGSGGISAQRPYAPGSARSVPVKFICTADQDQYLNAFYRTELGFGAEPFLIDLPMDGYGMVESTAQIVSGSLREVARFGDIIAYSATLEVLPQHVDTSADAAIVAAR